LEVAADLFANARLAAGQRAASDPGVALLGLAYRIWLSGFPVATTLADPESHRRRRTEPVPPQTNSLAREQRNGLAGRAQPGAPPLSTLTVS